MPLLLSLGRGWRTAARFTTHTHMPVGTWTRLRECPIQSQSIDLNGITAHSFRSECLAYLRFSRRLLIFHVDAVCLHLLWAAKPRVMMSVDLA